MSIKLLPSLFLAATLFGQAVEPTLDTAGFVGSSFKATSDSYLFNISVAKPLDTNTAAEFNDCANWTIFGTVVDGDNKTRLNPVTPTCPATDPDGPSVASFSVRKTSFGGTLSAGATISAVLVFRSPNNPNWPPFSAPVDIAPIAALTQSIKPVTIKLDEDGARDKTTKADIVLSGSLIAARGASPTYFYEAKLKYRFAPTNFNLNGSMVGNQGSAVDPDSIKAAIGYARPIPSLRGPALFWRTWIHADALRGEFTRKDQTANIGASVQFETLSKPRTFNPAKTRFAYLLWKAGLEAVKNTNKPDSIPELKAYKGGLRPLLGATLTVVLDSSAYGKAGEKVPRFTLTGDYLVRLPLAQEPFTRVIDEANVYSLSKKARHLADIGMLWQATNYWGVFSKYRYGSMPPLFIFTDHQILIGFAFQAKWK